MASDTALLIIDMQAGVLVDCFDADGVVSRTAALVDRARAEGTPVVWVQDHGDFPEGSRGWALAEPLSRFPGEALIRKGYRDSFIETDLGAVLADRGIRRLIVAGAQSDYCVRTTTQSAAVRGFDVTLVGDAHTTTDAEEAGVRITGQQIVAHTNLYFRGLRYPGRRFDVLRHHEVQL